MHLLSILTVIIIAVLIRHQPVSTLHNWFERWYRALFLLLFPALLIFSMAISILYMGCQGKMLGVAAGSWGCGLAGCLILFSLGCLVKLTFQSYCSIKNLNAYSQQVVNGVVAKVVDSELLFSAQIGFWNSELIVSSGLLRNLDAEHLEAVLAHEQAHLDYRDTFWFFWLGWIRAFTFWLPNTESLWQELLLLRELRADRKAAETVDFLLLAESLLMVVRSPFAQPDISTANFNNYQLGARLNERIDSLLAEEKPEQKNPWGSLCWICFIFLPLFSITLHY